MTLNMNQTFKKHISCYVFPALFALVSILMILFYIGIIKDTGHQSDNPIMLPQFATVSVILACSIISFVMKLNVSYVFDDKGMHVRYAKKERDFIPYSEMQSVKTYKGLAGLMFNRATLTIDLQDKSKKTIYDIARPNEATKIIKTQIIQNQIKLQTS